MFEHAEIGEPQAHGVRRAPPRGRRHEAEIAVGKGEKQDAGRGLAEIDGRFGFVERSLFRAQKMHGSGLLARQMPCDRHYVETFSADDHQASAPRFAKAPRAVETLLQTIADALDKKPHRLAAHLDKTLD